MSARLDKEYIDLTKRIVISVVIPTMDRNSLLLRALDSLVLQTFPKDCFEVLVVDNSCQESTRLICKKFMQNLPNLHYLPNPSIGLHSSRNMGLLQSRGEIVTYGDDDFKPGWKQSMKPFPILRSAWLGVRPSRIMGPCRLIGFNVYGYEGSKVDKF